MNELLGASNPDLESARGELFGYGGRSEVGEFGFVICYGIT